MDRIVERTVLNDIQVINKELDEIKNKQYVGSQSLLIYLVQSGASYDLSVTLTNSEQIQIYVRVGSENQPYFFYYMSGQVWKTAIDPANEITNPNHFRVTGNTNNYYNEPYYAENVYIIQNPDSVTRTFYLKLYIKMSDVATSLSTST